MSAEPPGIRKRNHPGVALAGNAFTRILACGVSYVDTQNRFEAMIRSRFLVKVQRDIDDPDAWRLIDLFTLD